MRTRSKMPLLSSSSSSFLLLMLSKWIKSDGRQRTAVMKTGAAVVRSAVNRSAVILGIVALIGRDRG